MRGVWRVSGGRGACVRVDRSGPCGLCRGLRAGAMALHLFSVTVTTVTELQFLQCLNFSLKGMFAWTAEQDGGRAAPLSRRTRPTLSAHPRACWCARTPRRWVPPELQGFSYAAAPTHERAERGAGRARCVCHCRCFELRRPERSHGRAARRAPVGATHRLNQSAALLVATWARAAGLWHAPHRLRSPLPPCRAHAYIWSKVAQPQGLLHLVKQCCESWSC